jgi:predicted XRE-type DNA-binding protein
MPVLKERKVRKQRQRNAFDDLGFSRAKADVLTIKVDLHSKIVRRAKRYRQSDLQKLLHESQPRISDLMRGKIANFSLDTLVSYARALGMRPEIRTHEPVRAMPAVAAHA